MAAGPGGGLPAAGGPQVPLLAQLTPARTGKIRYVVRQAGWAAGAIGRYEVLLARFAVVFEPGDPPRAGTVSFYHPTGDAVPDECDELGDVRELTLALPLDGPVAAWQVRVCAVPVADAVRQLVALRDAADVTPAAAFWSAVAVTGLHLVARGPAAARRHPGRARRLAGRPLRRRRRGHASARSPRRCRPGPAPCRSTRSPGRSCCPTPRTWSGRSWTRWPTRCRVSRRRRG